MSAPVELRKVYIRCKEGIPEKDVGISSWFGFKELGVEVVPYEWVDDVDSFNDLGPDVGVAGFTGDVERAFRKMGRTLPTLSDYPFYLDRYRYREIALSTLGAVREGRHGPRVFVKPQKLKLFTGFVYDADDAETRRRAITEHDDTPVIVSSVVRFANEWRAFILNHQPIDVRRYKGDWKNPFHLDSQVVEDAVRLGRDNDAPRAYILDFGILRGMGDELGQTALVERNEAYSFGGYGLPHVSYARMIAARWREMVGST